MFRFLGIILFVLSATLSSAQTAPDNLLSAIPGTLPPLDSVIGAAIKNSPVLKQSQANLNEKSADLSLIRRDWSQKIYTDAGWVNLSNTGDLVLGLRDENGQIIGGNSQISIIQGTSARVGVAARLSIYDLYARPKKIEKAKAQQEAIEYEYQSLEQNLISIITDVYLQLQLAAKVLELQQTTLSTFTAQYQMADKEFRQGEIQITELAKITEMKAKAELALEEAKMNYQSFYKQLELYTGRKLSSF